MSTKEEKKSKLYQPRNLLAFGVAFLICLSTLITGIVLYNIPPARAADDIPETFTEEVDGYTWTYSILDDGTAQAHHVSPMPEHCVIPDTLGGVPVTAVFNGYYDSLEFFLDIIIENYPISEGSIFYDSDYSEENNITISITLPDSVISIGPGAFASCSALQTVKLGNNVSIIDFMAFTSCSAMQEIFIPSSIVTIGIGAFIGCESLSVIYVDRPSTEIHLMDLNYFVAAEEFLLVFNEVLGLEFSSLIELLEYINNDDEYWKWDGERPVMWNDDPEWPFCYVCKKLKASCSCHTCEQCNSICNELHCPHCNNTCTDPACEICFDKSELLKAIESAEQLLAKDIPNEIREKIQELLDELTNAHGDGNDIYRDSIDQTEIDQATKKLQDVINVINSKINPVPTGDNKTTPKILITIGAMGFGLLFIAVAIILANVQYGLGTRKAKRYLPPQEDNQS